MKRKYHPFKHSKCSFMIWLKFVVCVCVCERERSSKNCKSWEWVVRSREGRVLAVGNIVVFVVKGDTYIHLQIVLNLGQVL